VAGLFFIRLFCHERHARGRSQGDCSENAVRAKTISVGVHPTVHVFGLAIDTDIVTSTLLAAAIFLYLGFRMVAKVTDGVPSKIQIFWEFLYDQVTTSPSRRWDARATFVPIGITLLLFILICNWIGFLPRRCTRLLG